jgi:hypothetical protein
MNYDMVVRDIMSVQELLYSMYVHVIICGMFLGAGSDMAKTVLLGSHHMAV